CGLRHAREQQITERIGHERQARIPGDQGALYVQWARRMLPADDAELCDLALVFAEILAPIHRLAVDGQAERRLLAVEIRDLKLAFRAADHERYPVVLIEDVL